MPRKRTAPELPELATFPARLTYARERAGMTKLALAKALGVDPGAITRHEQGERAQGIEAATLIRLARELGVPVGWLAADEGQLPPAPVFREGHDRRRKPHRDQGSK
jgi:transcriptional regulator with XRE-family HTH domain